MSHVLVSATSTNVNWLRPDDYHVLDWLRHSVYHGFKLSDEFSQTLDVSQKTKHCFVQIMVTGQPIHDRTTLWAEDTWELYHIIRFVPSQ